MLWAPLPLRVPVARADAVPRKPSAAAPPVALTLPVPQPLLETERVGEVEGEPEVVKRVLGVSDCEAHWLAVRLALLLALRAPEGEAEAVPRKPRAAAPPVALRQSVGERDGEELAEAAAAVGVRAAEGEIAKGV